LLSIITSLRGHPEAAKKFRKFTFGGIFTPLQGKLTCFRGETGPDIPQRNSNSFTLCVCPLQRPQTVVSNSFCTCNYTWID